MLMFMQQAAFMAKMRLRAFMTKENGEVNIIAMVILIAIAFLLAVLFRKQIGIVIDKLFSAINGNIDNVTESFSLTPNA